MKKECIAARRGNIRKGKFFYLLIFFLFCGGCSHYDNHTVYFNMLDHQKRTLQNKKAAEKFWSSVRPVSTLSASHYKLGQYYQQQEKYDKAIEEFSKAVQNDSGFCKGYNGIATSYDALARCEMAKKSYEQALLCGPQEAYLYNNYACSRLLCEDYDKGLALLIEALQLSEDNDRIKNNIKLAQLLIIEKNNSTEPVPDGIPVAFDAKTILEPAGNEDEKPLTEPTKEIVVKPAHTQPAADYSNSAIEVSNGNGVAGMAGKSADFFRTYGFTIRRITNAKHFHFNNSVIFYREGYLQVAKELARVIPGAQNMKKVDSLGRSFVGIRILLGKDLVKVQFPEGYAQNLESPNLNKEPLINSTIKMSNLLTIN